VLWNGWPQQEREVGDAMNSASIMRLRPWGKEKRSDGRKKGGDKKKGAIDREKKIAVTRCLTGDEARLKSSKGRFT